jgi:hypothetical protein
VPRAILLCFTISVKLTADSQKDNTKNKENKEEQEGLDAML